MSLEIKTILEEFRIRNRELFYNESREDATCGAIKEKYHRDELSEAYEIPNLELDKDKFIVKIDFRYVNIHDNNFFHIKKLVNAYAIVAYKKRGYSNPVPDFNKPMEAIPVRFILDIQKDEQ